MTEFTEAVAYDCGYRSGKDEAQAELTAKDAEITELKHEIEILRQYGNKDCTAMADEVIAKHRSK